MSDLKAANEDRVREMAYALWQEAGSPKDRDAHFWHLAEKGIQTDEREYDKTLADSFPASDPPANSGITT